MRRESPVGRRVLAGLPIVLAGFVVPALFVAAAQAQSLTNAALTANPNASAEAKAIMRYLRSLPARQDRKVISGQFESWGDAVKPLSHPSNNLAVIHQKTGKWVGLVGVEYHTGRVYPEAPNKLCIEYWKKAGSFALTVFMSTAS